MNKKGFSLTELIGVLVILSLVIVIVSTNGFGAFNNAKSKINDIDKKTIAGAVELLMLDIKHCDDSINDDLVTYFANMDYNLDGKISCADLKERANNGFKVYLKDLININYVSGSNIDKINEDDTINIYSEVKIDKNNDDRIIVGPLVEVKIEPSDIKYLENGLSTFDKIEEEKNNIKSINLVNYVSETAELTDISSNKKQVFLWLEETNPGSLKYDLYIGSKEKIYAPKNSKYLFSNFPNATSINLGNLDTSNVTDMEGMFSNLPLLQELNFSENFKTSSVTNMSNMFSGAKSLSSLDLSGFDTSNVTTMFGMFNKMSNLKTLNISSFNTSNVTNLAQMFDGVSNYAGELNLRHFDTSNVTSMFGMFHQMNKVTAIYFSDNIDTSKVEDMASMFAANHSITALDVSKFNTSKVTNMHGMFNELKNVTNLNVSSFDTSNVKNMSLMFASTSKLENITFSSKFSTINVITMESMFHLAESLTTLDLSSFNTSKVTNMRRMFAITNSLTGLDLSNFDTSSLIDNSEIFISAMKDGAILKVSSSNKEKLLPINSGIKGSITVEIAN